MFITYCRDLQIDLSRLHFLGVHYRTPLGCDFCHQSHVRLELSSRLRLENFEAIVGLLMAILRIYQEL